MAQTPQRFLLELADALAREAELVSDLFEGMLLAAAQVFFGLQITP